MTGGSALLETDTKDQNVQQRLIKLRQDPRRLCSLFWSLARPYWAYAPGAKGNLVWVIFLGLIRSGLSVVFSYISRDFWTALQKKDVSMFWHQIMLFTAVLVSALPVLVWYQYAKDRLSLRWRKWHTDKVLNDYFSQRVYYDIDQRGTVDNPDQRIANDITSFTDVSLTLFMDLFMSIIDLVNFSAILLTIYPKLFLVLFTYSSAGTVIAALLGRRMIHLNFVQLQREADFRYSLIRVRENAESIAFYNGEGREKDETLRRFFSAFLNKIDLIVWSRNLSFFTTSYAYLIQILPLSIIAPMYFSGSIELGVVSQAQQAFKHILDDLSLIISEFERVSEFSAGVDRLGELEEFIYSRFALAEDRRSSKLSFDSENNIIEDRDPNVDDDNEERHGFDAPSAGRTDLDSDHSNIYGREDAVRRFREIRKSRKTQNESEQDLLQAEDGSSEVYISTSITPNNEARIVVQNLTLMTPDRHNRVLFEDLSFTLESKQRLLIVGPSGTGKSSALRALAGLWTSGRGTIMRPKLESMFFLPQKPYCTLGSLKEQLVYPTPVQDSTVTDEELMEALELVDLKKLPSRVGGLDELRDWSTMLSLGEQQRLAFARLIIGKPSIAILDECSSALDIAAEDRLYTHLKNIGTGYLSVGHRPSLLQYHDIILRIHSDLSFTLENITADTSP